MRSSVPAYAFAKQFDASGIAEMKMRAGQRAAQPASVRISSPMEMVGDSAFDASASGYARFEEGDSHDTDAASWLGDQCQQSAGPIDTASAV